MRDQSRTSDRTGSRTAPRTNPAGDAAVGNILMESLFNLLLEDGSFLLLE
jgi:hypothetical protein